MRKPVPNHKQLSLFEETPDESRQVVTSTPAPGPAPSYTTGDIESMRAWLLQWGEKCGYPGFSFPFVYPPRNTDKDRRFGRIGRGLDGWKRDLTFPHTQFEKYEGEFLEKAIEQVKRYDAGEKIPYFEFCLDQLPDYSTSEEEE